MELLRVLAWASRLLQTERLTCLFLATVCFDPQEPFELLARRAVQQLMPPSLACKERVHEELVRIAEQACPPEAAR